MAAFTLCESYLVSYVCSMYTASSVLLAASATLAATVGLTYYAMTTKEDFTSSRFVKKGILSSVIWIALAVSLVNLFFIRSSILTMGIAALFAVIYSVYLLIDTQMILGGRHNQVQLDDYILGATVLYVDIISLFLKILQLLGKKKDD
jgi:protein lifeguard